MAQNQANQPAHTNRNAKASVFEDLFSDKSNLLELYKVLHPEDTSVKISDLKHISLRNILTKGRYNDLGFMVGNRLMILVEAQSTWSVNIIPRCIMYLAETWNRYFVAEAFDVYNSTPVEVPEPELYVLYTGDKQITKDYITLSEEFFDGKQVGIDATVKVLKYDGGTDIIDQYIFFCKTLDQQRSLYPNDALRAINETIRVCLNTDVLTDYLQNRRTEVVDIMLTLYSQEQATEMMLANERKQSEIKGIVETYQEFGKNFSDTVAMLKKKFGLSEKESYNIMSMYWKA